MIVYLKTKNFRSYKAETVFTMEASSSSNQKKSNIAEIHNGTKKLKVLKSAMIYGANASGKSNLIQVIFEICKLLLVKQKLTDPISICDPFLFDTATKNKNTEFEICFVGPRNIRFVYQVSIRNNIIITENLDSYPGKKNLISRHAYNSQLQTQKGTIEKNKEVSVFANQLILSRFGFDEPHELLSEVFSYFTNYVIINATNSYHEERINEIINNQLYNNESQRKRLSKLIAEADTQIKDIKITKLNEDDYLHLPESSRQALKQNPFMVFGVHNLYSEDKIISSQELPFSQESVGTRALYNLGGSVLKVLDTGGVLVVDELDSSLHPFITKMLVSLFHSAKVNPKNAQLIFTTHDVTLLDKDLIRRDQVWIAEKDKYGATELFSLQDFEGLREDTPFEKWYLAGKFGGLPKIKFIDSIFDLDA